MRRVMVLALLLATWAALGQDSRNRRTLGRNQTDSSSVVLSFAPASGAGLQSVSDLCDTYASELTGNFVCQKGDGTVYSGSRAMTSSGGPTTSSFAVCPNSLDCTAGTSQLYTGASSQSWNTASVATPTGSFSVCATFAGLPDNAWVFFQDNAVRGWELQHAATGAGQMVVWKAGAVSTSVGATAGTAPAGAWSFVCGTYQFVADGSSVLTMYANGAVSGTPSTTAVGPITAGNTPIGVGTGPFSNYTGRIRNALFTEKVLSPAVIAAMARTVLADVPTGAKGETLTFTRASTAFCTNSTGAAGTWLPINRPCITTNGIRVEGAATNLAIRSDAFDNVAWTKTNVTAPTADTQMAPDGRSTAELLVSTVNGGLVESTAAAMVGAQGTASVYVRTTAGTQPMAVRLRDTTGAADKCTGTLTATTTWQRVSCSAIITSGNNHTVRIYPGDTAGTGTVVAWGAQMEVTANAINLATSYIATAGTSVTRSSDVASMAIPSTASNSVGCMGATVAGWEGLNSAFSRVLDTDSGNPLYVTGSTGGGADDAVNSMSFNTSPSMFLGAVRHTIQWTGATMRIAGTSKVCTPDPQTYDGSIWGVATVSLGSNAGSADFINGVLADIRIGKTTVACE